MRGCTQSWQSSAGSPEAGHGLQYGAAGDGADQDWLMALRTSRLSSDVAVLYIEKSWMTLHGSA